jgi:hypothetical protein
MRSLRRSFAEPSRDFETRAAATVPVGVAAGAES